MSPSGHTDPFAREHLPPRDQWPEFLFELPQLDYAERFNCADAFIDAHVAAGQGDAVALIGSSETLSYAALKSRAERIARLLREELRLPTGARVLLRGANSPALAAAWLGVVKAGMIAVTTMPLLRARELSAIVVKARVAAALCDHALAEEMQKTQQTSEGLLQQVLFFNAPDGEPDGLETRIAGLPDGFASADTAADDVALIAFTSGTTGVPKGTMHFHRDVLAICDVLSRQVIAPRADDVFIGTPPLAFTFGLGGLFLFPLRVGAAAVLVESWTPESLLAGIARHRATILFTAPTFYRRMAPLATEYDLGSLRITVSSGEMLPADTRRIWREASGIEMTECLGSTELLHAFIACTPADVRPGATGRVVPGYRACVLDHEGREAPVGEIGRLAIKGPTGCRYLDDARQRDYVQDGWNLTGDAYRRDADGYFWYQSRTDDMIISAGYNIAGPEVEDVLLTHAAVAECGVVGVPDEARGQIVKAFVVVRAGHVADAALAAELQQLVKDTLAPYKYPRAVEFVEALPRTENGKIQRFKLRASAPAGRAY
ncbi:MAG: AMP-binding protein [Burkholderiales bacterium]|nr:AMP-binding protein [Burkholderiales bacterium]